MLLSHPELNAFNLTDSARHIIDQVVNRATDRALITLDDLTARILVLWSMLRWERKLGLIAIEQLVDHCADFVYEIDLLLTEEQCRQAAAIKALISGDVRMGVAAMDLTPIILPLLHEAQAEAVSLGCDYIGSEHILLALAASSRGDLFDVLYRHGLTHEQIKSCVKRLLNE